MKYLWLFIAFLFTIVTTVYTQGATNDVINGGYATNTLPQDAELSISTAESFFDTYWRLLTFDASITATDSFDVEYQVLEIPSAISYLFLLFNLIIGVIVLELAFQFLQSIPFV